MKKAYELLTLRQVEKKLEQLRPLKELKPKMGWIAYVSEVLSLPAVQLAKLMHVKQPSIVAMEKREQSKTITLETLEKAANAMGCELVYGFVPKTTLEGFVDLQRKEFVRRTLKNTNLTMALESQGLNKKSLKQQEEILLEEIKGRPLKHLWRLL